MVEVFKTNVWQKKDAGPLIKGLSARLPGHKISIDIEDCDKVLRVEGETIHAEKIIGLLEQEGFKCAIMNY